LEDAISEATVSGTQNTAVIMLDFPTLPSECTSAAVEDLMFTGPDGTTVDDLYQEMSSGLVSLSGQVFGPVALSQGDPQVCDTNGWANEADEVVRGLGIDVSTYARRVYVIPRGTACSYAGLGQVGGTSTRAWVLRCDLNDVYAHELGHNFGWGHAAKGTNPYGDVSGIMGYSGYNLRHANGPHQVQMNWVGNGRVQDISTDGDYWIDALALIDDQAVGPQVLRFPKADDGAYYYVSYRDTIGFDDNLSNLYRRRMNVHRYAGSGSAKTYLEASLLDGESWNDPLNGITVTRLSTSGTSVLARVSFDDSGVEPGCTVQAPTLSLNPSSQAGLAGTPLEYGITLTNRDGADCASSVFTLSAVAPADWTTQLSPQSLTLEPGASGSATLSVVSSSSASAGDHTVTVSAADPAEIGHAASAAAVYRVDSSCTANHPDVTVNPGLQAADPGATVSYSITVANRDSDACGASLFTLSAIHPSGWTASVSPTSLTLAPGDSASATLAISSPDTATAGQYAVGAEATSAADEAYAAVGQGVYEVNTQPPTGDSEPPTPPSGLSASVKRKGVNLTWNAASDNVGVAGYRLFRDGVLAADVGETTYSDKTGSAGAIYYVVAYDAAGNVSQASQSVVAENDSPGKGGGGGKGGGKGGK
jgi:hypothetical protein